MRAKYLYFASFAYLFGLTISPLMATQSYAPAQLRAGAARVDITPAVADLPKPFTTIHTDLYVRTLVLESGGTRVVIVVGDLPNIVADVFEDLTHRIAKMAGAPVENVLLAVTHMHNGVRLDNTEQGILLPGSAKVTKTTGDQIIESVRQALANLGPARAGYGTGVFHLAELRANGTAPAGSANENQGAPIGVFKVERENGEPIALLMNNGPEPVMGMMINNRIDPDVAGIAERYIEQRFSDKVVALYTVGSPPSLVINSRQRVPGAKPADPDTLMNAVGTVLGEEVLSTASRIKTSSQLRLSGAVQVLTCPGKTTTPLNNAASCSDAPDSKLPRCIFTDQDAGPVNLRIGLIQLGDLSVLSTDSNISQAVWAQVRGQAPSPANTMLVALTYGPMHYVEPDAEYPTNSYPVTASMVKRGCAEKGFVDDALRLLKADTGGTAK